MQHLTPPIKNTFKFQPTLGKVMLITLFWDLQGQILEHYQEKGVMKKSACCSELLHVKLKVAIQSKC